MNHQPKASRSVQPVGEATARQAARRELEYALEVLTADFNGASGSSGLRAEAMAHVRKALLYLRGPAA